MNDDDNPESLTSVLEQLCESTDGETVSFADIVQALDQRSYGPLLLVPALVAVAPTGAIPGMSIVTGTIIFVIALQLLVGRSSPWLPDGLLNFSFSRDRLVQAIEKSRGYTKWFDKALHPRLIALTEFPSNRLVAIACMALAVTMFPLALLPFAVAVPGTAIALLGLGLTARDGVFVIAGFVCAAAAFLLGAYWAWVAQSII